MDSKLAPIRFENECAKSTFRMHRRNIFAGSVVNFGGLSLLTEYCVGVRQVFMQTQQAAQNPHERIVGKFSKPAIIKTTPILYNRYCMINFSNFMNYL